MAPTRRRWIDRTEDVFVLLPAGFGALFLILDLGAVCGSGGDREPGRRAESAAAVL